MGESLTAAIGYYPNWGQSESKCLNDANVPDYMRRFYNWDENKCIANSGGGNAAGEVGTGKWYVDYYKGSCKQDNNGEAKNWHDLHVR